MKKIAYFKLKKLAFSALLVQSIIPMADGHSTVFPPLITSGSYSNGTNTFPLLATSIDGGVNWIYTINGTTPTLPSGTTTGTLNSAYCINQTCVAAGQYAQGSISYPLLATSTDGGVTWVYSIDKHTPPLPYGTISGYLTTLSCSDATCITAGSYFLDASYYPLLATSSDGGVSWTYTINRETLSLPNMKSGHFISTHCSASTCIVGGRYTENINEFPLLAMSQDDGVNWSYRIDGTSPAQPSDMIEGYFNAVHCSSLNCVAAGQYNNGINNYPLLASSTDGGSSWNYVINSSTPTLPPGATSAYFSSAHCNGTTCIVAGQYSIGVNYFPLLATSSDGGVNWNYTVDAATPTLPNGAMNGKFVSVKSSAQAFIAVGQYSKGINYYPLLAMSTDGGLTWSYAVNNLTPILPGDAINARFLGASCSGLTCTAAGNYYNGISYYPLLATSTDGGGSWNYAINSATPTLPFDYLDYGVFSSSRRFNRIHTNGLSIMKNNFIKAINIRPNQLRKYYGENTNKK